MSLPKDQAWFPRKRYGWGWGIPSKWQGWVVMIAWLVALIAGSPLVAINPFLYIAHVVIISGILTAFCYWKGESPEWHWGDEK